MSYRFAFRGCCGPRESWGDVYYGNDPAKQNWQKINSLSEVGMFAGGEIEWYYPTAYSDQRSEERQHRVGEIQLFVLGDGSSVSFLPYEFTSRNPESITSYQGFKPEVVVADRYGEVLGEFIAHLPGGLGSNDGVRNWDGVNVGTYPVSDLRSLTVTSNNKIVSVWTSAIKLTTETDDELFAWGSWSRFNYGRCWVQCRSLDNTVEWEVPIEHAKIKMRAPHMGEALPAGTPRVERPGLMPFWVQRNEFGQLTGTQGEGYAPVLITAGRDGEVIISVGHRGAANNYRLPNHEESMQTSLYRMFCFDSSGNQKWRSAPFDGEHIEPPWVGDSYLFATMYPSPTKLACDSDGNPWAVIRDRQIGDTLALYKLSRGDGSKILKVLLTQHTNVTDLVPDRAGGMYVHGGGTLTKVAASGSIAWTIPGQSVITGMDRVCSVSFDNKTLWGVGSGFSFENRPSRVRPHKGVVGDYQLPVFIDVSGPGPPTMESRCGVLYDDDPTLPAMFGSSAPAKILGWAEVVKCFPGEPAPFG